MRASASNPGTTPDDDEPVEGGVEVEAPTEGTEQEGDTEETPEITETPADPPAAEPETTEVKEESSDNPTTGISLALLPMAAAAAALAIFRKQR